MAEVRYLISDAARQVGVETHVLRYWEDELKLDIPRNDMGHRYYTDYQIRLFCQIRDLKDQGYQLKAIRNALNKMSGAMEDITITEDLMEEEMKTAWKENHVRSEQTKENTVSEAEGQSGAKGQTDNVPPADDGANEPDNGGDGRELSESLVPVQETAPAGTLNADEKMARFQEIMNHIIGQAVEVNMARISQEITEDVSDAVSENVTDRVMKEVEYLLRVSDEKEEERFKQLDETIRAYQNKGKGRAEAAAAKTPLFRKRRFGRSGKKLF